MYEALDPVVQSVLISIERPMAQSTKIDGAVIEATQELDENMKRDFVVDAQSTIVQDADPAAQNIPLSIEMPLARSTKIDGEGKSSELILENNLSCQTTSSVIAEHIASSSKATSSSTTRVVSEIDNKEGESDEISNLKAQNESMKELASVQEYLALITLRDNAQGNMISSTASELHQTIQRPLVQNVEDEASGSEETKEITQIPLAEANTLIHSSVQETDENFKRPLVQTTHQGTSNPSIVQETDIKNQEMNKTSEKALVSFAQNVLRSSVVDNTDIRNQELCKISEKALVPVVQNKPSTSMDDNIDTSWKNVEGMSIPASSVQNIAAETHVTHVSIIDKPSVQATQNAWDITIVQNKEESHDDSDVHLSKNLFIQSITSTSAHNKQNIGAQETYESNRGFSIYDAQNDELSPAIVYNTVGKSHDPEIIFENLYSQATNSAIDENKAIVDPSPSKTSSSSTTSIAEFCSSFSDLDISAQLLPYLDAGVNQHPQVLDWLNSKRRRVFASSYFSLFAEVTRILKTTQKGYFTEEDQNYIKECCGVLQGVGFHESWISYVHGYIEEDVNKRIKEAEDEASNLKAQVDSMKKDLALLRDKKAQGSVISSSRQVLGFSWRSTCKNLFMFIIVYLIMCVLIYGLSKLPF